MVKILRPLIIVRIGFIDIGRIGGAYLGDWYLSEKKNAHHQGRYYDLFYFVQSTNHANDQWVKMWKEALPYVPGTKFWRNLVAIAQLLPGQESHQISETPVYPGLETWQLQQEHCAIKEMEVQNERLKSVLLNSTPNICFTDSDKKRGQRTLKKLGIPTGKSYICFHSRDSVYLDTVMSTTDWSYHNYRDSNIQNYVQAAEEMANRGYYAVRMGVLVKEKIRSSHPLVIDYATNGHRTDFSDAYIGSHCRFFLCSDGGMSIIPEMFRVPAIYVNWTSILRISTWVLNGIFIFKKFYLTNEGRYLTFSEIMNLDFGGRDTNEIFETIGLEVIENTAEEIYAVTVEMDERLNCTWKTTKEDEKLQAQFWALFGPDKLKSQNLRIGADYLRQNRDLVK